MIKIQPINIEDGASVQSITKNITSSVAFMLATANEINRVISDINCIEHEQTSAFDDSEVKSLIKNMAKDIEEISCRELDLYNDEQLIIELSDIKKENVKIKGSIELCKSELKSYRQIAGHQIDELNQKLNKLSEVK